MMIRLNFTVARVFGYLVSSLLWNLTLINSQERTKTQSGQTPVARVSFFRNLISRYTRKGKEISFRHRLRRLIGKHLGLHLQNIIPREGVNQLPWVQNRALGMSKAPETVQGHVGACDLLAEDFGKLLGWPRWRIDHLRQMISLHEIDEIGHGDVSLFNMAQKRSSDWKPMTRDEWLAYRRRKYFESGGRERVAAWIKEWIEEYDGNPDDGRHTQALNDEFATAKTDVARIANQIDALQGVMEAGARFIAMRKRARRPAKSVKDARWNFLNYYSQGEQIMEHPVLRSALATLKEECLGKQEMVNVA